MGLIRGFVSLLLSVALVVTVTAAHVVTLSEQTILTREVGERLLAQTPVTQELVHLTSVGLIALTLGLLAVLYLVVRSTGTVGRRLGISLVVAGAPFYALGYLLKNRPEAVLSMLGERAVQFVLALSRFTQPFIDTVSQRSLVVLVAGIGLIVLSVALPSRA